jgi:hypothetical protein
VVNKMKKLIALLVATIFLLTLFCGTVVASTGGDEHYNDDSNEYAQGEQPDPDDIPGMNREEDRTRNKDN